MTTERRIASVGALLLLGACAGEPGGEAPRAPDAAPPAAVEPAPSPAAPREHVVVAAARVEPRIEAVRIDALRSAATALREIEAAQPGAAALASGLRSPFYVVQAASLARVAEHLRAGATPDREVIAALRECAAPVPMLAAACALLRADAESGRDASAALRALAPHGPAGLFAAALIRGVRDPLIEAAAQTAGMDLARTFVGRLRALPEEAGALVEVAPDARDEKPVHIALGALGEAGRGALRRRLEAGEPDPARRLRLKAAVLAVLGGAGDAALLPLLARGALDLDAGELEALAAGKHEDFAARFARVYERTVGRTRALAEAGVAHPNAGLHHALLVESGSVSRLLDADALAGEEAGR